MKLNIRTMAILAMNISASNSTHNLQGEDGDLEIDSLSALGLVVRGMVMASIIMGAIFGNVLVISSVLKFERLRVITNFFIVSLAFADLLVAIMVMPFNASIEISRRWVFGRTVCDIYNANDVLFSTSSILHLCCISMDRYIAIIHPLKYERKMTRHRALLMLGCTWVASILISYIPVYTQLYTTEENFKAITQDPDSCPFIVNRIYAGVSSSVSFWIPCTIMVFVYIKIFIEARKQEKMIQSCALYMHYSDARMSNGTSPEKDAQKSVRRRMKREHKAAKTLGIIMGAFILCFLPFFSWYFITTMCGSSCPFPPILQPMLFWIGYFNSCLNPIIYAFFNREFRSAFKKLLHLDRMPCDAAHHNHNHNDAQTRALTTNFVESNNSNRLQPPVKEPCRTMVRITDNSLMQ